MIYQKAEAEAKNHNKKKIGGAGRWLTLLVMLLAAFTTLSSTALVSAAPTLKGRIEVGPPVNQRGVVAEGELKVLYQNGNTQPNANSIIPRLIIVNNTQSSVPMSELSVRYFYTRDDQDINRQQEFHCDYAPFGSQFVVGQFKRMAQSQDLADNFLEVSFKDEAPTLEPGQDSGLLMLRFNKSDWSTYDQTNDYSFNPEMTIDYQLNLKMALYRNGQLVWGKEPTDNGNGNSGGNNPKPTLQPTNPPAPTATATPKPQPTTTQPPVPAATPTATPTQPPAPTPTQPPAPVPTTGPGADPKGFVSRQGNKLFLDGKPFRFSGTNMPWLGLDEFNERGGREVSYPTHFRIDDGLATAQLMSITVVRSNSMGISVGCQLCLMPALGQYNEAAFEPMDYALASAKAHNVRLIIPLADQWHYYHGGKHNFTNWLGYSDIAGADPANNQEQKAREANFYTDPKVIAAFRDYVARLMNHKNQYTGLAYKDDPTIMAWESGNEIWDATDEWTQSLAEFIKGIAPNQLFSDGSAASGLHVTQSRASLSAVDIVGGHFYPLDVNWLRQDAALAGQAGKVYYVGEYDWRNFNGGTPLAEFLGEVWNNPNISGATFWEIRPHGDSGGFIQHEPEKYDFHYPGDNSAITERINQLFNLGYAMAGLNLPQRLPAPAQPHFITPGENYSSNQLYWQGVAGATGYSIERSDTGESGPFKLICERCASDMNVPWTDSTRPQAGISVSYRLRAFNKDGVGSDYSPVYSTTGLPPVDPPGMSTDNLNDWSKVYSHSPNLTFDHNNVSFFDGDNSRLMRTGDGAGKREEVVYKQDGGIKSFEMTAYFWPLEAVDHFSIYTSTDGNGWQQVSPGISGGSGDWKKYIYRLDNLTSTNYVKIVFNNTGGNFWNGEIGKVSLLS